MQEQVKRDADVCENAQDTINILGETWTICVKDRAEDEFLTSLAGYCDRTSRRIVIADYDGNLDNHYKYMNECVRHEIIHAFALESGLGDNWKHDTFGHDEMAIDWFAIQYPKIKAVFKQLGVEA